LSRANLNGAELRGANLSQTNLEHVILSHREGFGSLGHGSSGGPAYPSAHAPALSFRMSMPSTDMPSRLGMPSIPGVPSSLGLVTGLGRLEQVAFTGYYPREAAPLDWEPLLVFIALDNS
jgi:hypothetical protein